MCHFNCHLGEVFNDSVHAICTHFPQQACYSTLVKCLHHPIEPGPLLTLSYSGKAPEDLGFVSNTLNFIQEPIVKNYMLRAVAARNLVRKNSV